MKFHPIRSAFIAAAAFACVVAANVASAQPTAAPSATMLPAVAATQTWCPLSTRVRDLDDAHTLYGVSLRALETSRASGIVTMWAGDRRYDVAFHDLVALDTRDLSTPDTTVVVRFPAPTALDGAVVTSLEQGGTRRSCDPWFSPWVATNARPDPTRLTLDERRLQEQVLAGARAAVAVDAPAAVADPKPCTTPDRAAGTVRVVEPEMPPVGPDGFAMVEVLLDPSDHVVGTRIQRSAGNVQLDNLALRAARLSEFQGQTFRCRRVIGSYLFGVEFNS